MSQSVIQNLQNKDTYQCHCPNAISPTIASLPLSTSQPIIVSEIDQYKNFLIQAQIPWNDLNSDDKSLQKKLWSLSQQELLINLHNQYGNKWTDIALNFPGRDHNCVKNHFYAQVRKSLRRLNYFSKIFFNNELKQLNINHVSKMITMLSEKRPGIIFDEIDQNEIKDLKKYFFDISKRQQNDSIDNTTKQEMKKYIKRIFVLLEKVKRTSYIGNKLRNKKQVKSNQVKANSQKTFRIALRDNKKEQADPNLILPSEQTDKNLVQTNMVVFYLPLNIPNPSHFSPYFGFQWMNPIQQQIFVMDSNIFTNS